jgi:hypothetical protein
VSQAQIQSRGTAWLGFDDLCANPLGAADYLAIAERFAGNLSSKGSGDSPLISATRRGGSTFLSDPSTRRTPC